MHWPFSKIVPNYIDNRHARAVKVSLNKIFGNKSTLNKELSIIITNYSHRSILAEGSFLVSSNLKFFVVQRLLSNHWCIGWFCPSRIATIGTITRYVPNLLCRGKIVRKRINSPFSRYPNINIRNLHFHLQSKNVVTYNISNNNFRLFHDIIAQII